LRELAALNKERQIPARPKNNNHFATVFSPLCEA
jgi:hypothetical protein